MTATSVLTLSGAPLTISDEDIAGLRSAMRGPVLLQGEAEYETSRRVWNGNIDRFPGLVARCTGVADVQAAVNFARSHNLLVAIRGGAHNAAGNGTTQGGMQIDLAGMKGIHVDPVARTARAQGGVLWADFDRETQVHGLATTGGTVSNTGVAGLTLGGGIGWLMGEHGLSVDNLLSVDIVTADGRAQRASATENPDLFWAVRGGGGNFGVITSFEFRVHPVGPQVLGGMVIHLLQDAPEVLRFYRDFSANVPDKAAAFAGLLTAPDGPPVVAMILGYNGDLAEGERVLAPARAFGSPIQDVVGPMSYCARQSLLDEPNAIHGIQRYWKSGYSADFNDSLIDTAVDAAGTFISPMSAMLFVRVSGKATRVPSGDTAVGLRTAQWDCNVVSQWLDPSESPKHIAWARDVWAKIDPLISQSAYINHIASDDSPEKVRASYGPGIDRLTKIKKTYDPANMFRINANIQPG